MACAEPTHSAQLAVAFSPQLEEQVQRARDTPQPQHWLFLFFELGAAAWQHRGGRKCGPDCRCEDHF
jgi:hypothetical protein